jgi:hypothetical protein
MKNFLLATAVVLICAGGSAAQMSLGKESLKRLPGVVVIVEDLSSQMVDAGVNKDQIQQDVELRLRKADIRVLSRDTSSAPVIDVIIGGVKVPKTNATAYAISLTLSQRVILERDPSIKLYAQTWWAGVSVGYVINGTEIRNELGDVVDSFINDYLSQNPR